MCIGLGAQRSRDALGAGLDVDRVVKRGAGVEPSLNDQNLLVRVQSGLEHTRP